MRWFVLILLGVFCWSPVFAQSYVADPQYEAMTRRLLSSPEKFDYNRYRAYYAGTSQYDPLGEALRLEMLDLAQAMQAQTGDAAKARYEALIYDHLANIGVVNLALSLSLQDKRFGDARFFQMVRDGLFQTVLYSGNGLSLSNAYDVITLDEEVMLLRHLNVRPQQSTQGHEGAVYYTMHDYPDPAMGARRTVFVNTSLPMKHLTRQVEATPKALNLRRQ